jgi:molybdate transport system regulatory protein
MHIAYRIWLELGGQAIFGMGLYKLLSLVNETGSLQQAAKSLNMSYRAAWGKVRTVEKRMGADLLERGRHGRNGSHLTATGQNLLGQYTKLLGKVDQALSKEPITEIVVQIKQDIVNADGHAGHDPKDKD